MTAHELPFGVLRDFSERIADHLLHAAAVEYARSLRKKMGMGTDVIHDLSREQRDDDDLALSDFLVRQPSVDRADQLGLFHFRFFQINAQYGVR